MGTISDKLIRIINTKEDIRQALISKGYDVPTSIPFKEYAKMILDLPCNADSFPDIEGIVARYSASGITNEQMAANPVWVDKTGNGRDLQLKNFSWKGMSGVGGYVGDFSKWVNNRDTTEIGITKSNSKVIIDVKVSQGSGKNIVFISKSNLGISNNVTIKITSTYPEGVMKFANSASNKYLKLPSNGIITLQDNPEYTSNEMHLHLASADLGQITIEQLPLYPGALVFDGVDDYGTCDNFPILTKEKGYTVVALRRWLSLYEDNKYYTLLTNSNQRDKGAFAFEEFNNRSKGTFNFGNYTVFSSVNLSMPFTYQTSTSYNGKAIAIGGLKEGVNLFQVCKIGSNYCSKAAIWEIVILDHDATEEELTKIKDYFVKTYPWLFFDQAWTVTGKTNEDEDRATIANITGNGNDLILSNFGFAEGSGYGLYQQNYSIWNKVDNRATFTVTSSKIHVTSVIREEHADFIYTTGQQLKQKIRITGLPEGASFVIGRSGVNLKVISQDGIYDIDILDDSSENPIIGYRINKIIDSCDITIEQIPEYEGYLVTDGVDDKVQSSSFTMNEDWTIVGDWELLSNVQINCGIVKAQNVYLYNIANGLLISINNPRSLQSFGTKSLHAICSDGRLYDRNWVEYEYTVDQNFAIVESSLNIGFNLNNYTQIAFKNLGIYNDQLLSKDDCIKAYNYLQTLKAK